MGSAGNEPGSSEDVTRDVGVPVDFELEGRSRLGRFELRDELGRGGMGVVYRAYDPELDREVALKAIRRGISRSLGPSRVIREAQSMARLSHPGIIEVYDVGQDHGTLYIAMEYLRGCNLAAWLREPRAWRDVLSIFIDVANALQAAHDAGLVHRDIKPSNIMLAQAIDGTIQRACLVDFGLARPHDHPHTDEGSAGSAPERSWPSSDTHTRSDVIVGTPAYMAPEQQRGPATAASDQFSLCVALYEALYRVRPPRPDEPAGDVRYTPQDPEIPATLRRAVLRGLKGDPRARWPSVEALAGALRRAQDRRPRWIVPAAAAGLLGTAMAWPVAADPPRCEDGATAAASLWSPTHRSEAARDWTELVGMERAWNHVATRLDDHALAWSEAYASSCRDAYPDLPGGGDAVRACLDHQLPSFRSAVRSVETATVETASRVMSRVEDLPRPEDCLDTARQRPLPPEPSRRQAVFALRREIAEATNLVGQGRYDTGLQRLRDLQPSIDTVAFPPLEAEWLLAYGNLSFRVERHQDAADALEQAFVVASANDDASVAAQAASLRVFAALRGGVDLAAARRWMEQMRAWAPRDMSPRTARMALRTQAAVEHYAGDHEASLLHYTALVAELEHADEPRALALAYNDQSAALSVLGRLDEAVEASEKAIALLETSSGPDHPDLVAPLANLGSHLPHLGEPERAVAVLERALSIARRIHAGPQSGVGEILSQLGQRYTALGRHDQAHAMLEEALGVATASGGADGVGAGVVQHDLGALELERGDPDAARPHLERSLAIFEERLGAMHFRTGYVQTTLAGCALAQGDAAEALRLLDAAAVVEDANYPPTFVDRIRGLQIRRRASEALGRDEDIPAIDEAIAAIRRAHPRVDTAQP